MPTTTASSSNTAADVARSVGGTRSGTHVGAGRRVATTGRHRLGSSTTVGRLDRGAVPAPCVEVPRRLGLRVGFGPGSGSGSGSGSAAGRTPASRRRGAAPVQRPAAARVPVAVPARPPARVRVPVRAPARVPARRPPPLPRSGQRIAHQGVQSAGQKRKGARLRVRDWARPRRGGPPTARGERRRRARRWGRAGGRLDRRRRPRCRRCPSRWPRRAPAPTSGSRSSAVLMNLGDGRGRTSTVPWQSGRPT